MAELLHDWNGGGCPGELASAFVLDETLRDGIQSPSAIDPQIESKVEILHLLDELGVYQLDVGLPGAGAHQRAAGQRAPGGGEGGGARKTLLSSAPARP